MVSEPREIVFTFRCVIRCRHIFYLQGSSSQGLSILSARAEIDSLELSGVSKVETTC